jgi:hypothetical protein
VNLNRKRAREPHNADAPENEFRPFWPVRFSGNPLAARCRVPPARADGFSTNIMSLHELIPVVPCFHYVPLFASKFGVNGAILLGWMIWSSRHTGERIEAAYEEIEKATGLTERKIDSAREALKGVIYSDFNRLEHKMVYWIDENEVRNLLCGGTQ